MGKRKSFNEVEELGGARLTEGKHIVKIVKIEEKTSSNGNPMYNITYQNDDGIAWDRLVMTEKALGFTKRLLSACGYDIDALEYEEDNGQVVGLYLDDEEYTIEQLLQDEEVEITLKKADSTYKDPATGETITRENDSFDVVDIQPVDEE